MINSYLSFLVRSLMCGMISCLTFVATAQNCNDLTPQNVELFKHPERTEVDINRERVVFFWFLNYPDNAEVRYRKRGNSNWIYPSGNITVVPVPVPGIAVLYVLDGDFTLNTEYGNIDYELQIRISCTLEGWGPWLIHDFNSYCGVEGLSNQPTDVDAEELTYENEYATQGRLSDDEGETFFKKEDYVNNRVVFDNLRPNTEYWFKCRAQCEGDKWSPYTDLARVKTKCNPPRSTEVIPNSQNMGTQIGVSCTRNAEQYEFRMRLKGNSNWTSSNALNNDSYTFPQMVDKGDIYELQCRIYCSDQWTDWSSIVEYSIPVNCPQPSGNIGVNSITDKTAHFYCNSGHGSGVTEGHHFRYRESSGSDWTESFTMNNSIDVSGLNGNTEYVMQIQHECTNGVTGNWSNMEFFTTDISCNLNSSAISIRDITYTSALLHCKQTERDGYTWEVIRIRDGKMIQIPNQLPDSDYLLDSLAQGEEYQVRLKVHCGTANSGFTEPVLFTTLFCNHPVENDIAVTDIGNTYATFVYDGNINQGIEWNYRKFGNQNWRKAFTNLPARQVDSLLKNAMYEYRMRILCSEQPDEYSEWSAIHTFQTACVAFIKRFSQITTSSIVVHSNEAEADGYIFRYRMLNGGNWNTLNEVPDKMITITGLIDSTNYEFQVRAVCNGTAGDWSDSDYATTRHANDPPCRVLKRSELEAINITAHTVELNCTRGNADFYIFRYSEVLGGNWIESPPLSQGFYPVAGLASDTRYMFQCRVVCGMDQSDWSDTIRFRTAVEVIGLNVGCPTPFQSDFIAFNIGFLQVYFDCFKTADEYAYRYRELNAIDWTELPANINSRQLVNGLSPNTIYEYQSRIFCNGVNGGFSESRFFRTLKPGTCDPPGLDATKVVDLTTQEASIAVLNQARLYQLRYKLTDGDSWIFSDTNAIPLFKLNELEPGREYVYQLRVVCANNEISPYSNSKNFRTLDLCSPVLTDDIDIITVTHSSVLIAHSENPLRSGYLIRYRPTGSNEWTISTTVTNSKRFFQLMQLNEFTEYEFQVLGICSDVNLSTWSPVKKFMTKLAGSTIHDEKSRVRIYPNPAQNELFVNNLDMTQELELSIMDLQGRILQVRTIDTNTTEKISLALFPGLYLVQAKHLKSRSIFKLIIADY